MAGIINQPILPTSRLSRCPNLSSNLKKIIPKIGLTPLQIRKKAGKVSK
jgi:hypothetical protein